jgi:hypothetical protein
VGASDPALEGDYLIRFEAAVCGEPRPDDSTMDIPLPDDPWLFYWQVPAGERRHFRYAGFDARMSPCSDDDLAELPLPYYYWYDWWPTRAGRDLDGQPYDCKALLVPGRDFVGRPVRLVRKARPEADFAELRTRFSKGPLSATVLIGVLDYHASDLGLETLREKLGRGKDPAARARALIAEQAYEERGELFLLRYLASLDQLVDFRSFESAIEDGSLAITVEGTLRRSGRAVTLRNYVGLTDIFGLSPPRHWPILRRALARDAVVIYAGHSGIGENFRLSQIASHVQAEPALLKAEGARVPFQLIAFLSCYSYMYFGQDLIAAGQPREYVFTGTEFTRGDLGALSILDLVDQALAGETPALRYLDPADFVLVKQFTAP